MLVVNAGRLELVHPGVAHLNVATLQSQAEASLLIFHKVQRYFRVAFLLQVGDDGLTDQLGITHHVQNLRGTMSQQLEAENLSINTEEIRDKNQHTTKLSNSHI